MPRESSGHPVGLGSHAEAADSGEAALWAELLLATVRPGGLGPDEIEIMRLSMTPLLLHQYLNTEPGSVELPKLRISGSSQIAIEMTRDLGLEVGNPDNFSGSSSAYRREYSRLYGRVGHPAPPVPFVPAAMDILTALDPLEGDRLTPVVRRPVRANFGVLGVCWAMALVFFVSIVLVVLN